MENKTPLVSIIIIFYNQELFVDDAIDGALSQTYDNCEIILSDDCSSDNTYEHIINKVKAYCGNKKIIVNRNERNMGLVPHVNKVIYELSHGDFILLTGGDDISLPNRANDTVSLFKENPNISMVTLSAVYINKIGEEISKYISKDRITFLTDLDYLKSSSLGAGANAMAYKRSLLFSYDPLKDDCQTEDSTLRFRSILKGPILSSNILGIKYRIHGNNISGINNIYKLKSRDIANQYRIDLQKEKPNISTGFYKLLQLKINYYEKFREISAKQARVNNNFIVSYIYKLRHFILRRSFYLKIRFNTKIINSFKLIYING